MSNQEALSRIYAERGYLVIARHKRERGLAVGEIVTDTTMSPIDRETTQPLRVVVETNREDFMVQCGLFGGTPIIDMDYDRFYRAEGD